MVLVLVQVGLLVRDHILIVHATREAARAAAVEPTTEAAASAARAASGLDPGRLQVETTGSRTAGGLLRVTVRYRPETRSAHRGPVLSFHGTRGGLDHQSGIIDVPGNEISTQVV